MHLEPIFFTLMLINKEVDVDHVHCFHCLTGKKSVLTCEGDFGSNHTAALCLFRLLNKQNCMLETGI